MRTVLDANVLAAGVVGLPRPESTPGDLLRRWFAGDDDLVVSEIVLSETDRTLGKPYFRRRLLPSEQAAALGVLRRRASLALITVHVQGIATHPEDDLVLATAVSAAVDYLVTGDKMLQALGQYEGVSIVSPRDFLTLLERQEGRN